MIYIKNIEHLEANRFKEIVDIVDNFLTKEEKIKLDAIKTPGFLLKKVIDDGYAEINGRKYDLHTFVMKKSRKVWAFFSSITVLIDAGNYSFLDNDKYEEIEALIFENTTFENCKLSEKHFEKYRYDYMKYIVTMMGAVSYPFFAESPTD